MGCDTGAGLTRTEYLVGQVVRGIADVRGAVLPRGML